jgi:predicted MFS family arabinose efflux permease
VCSSDLGALIVLAFCMTALSMPMRTFFPKFVTDVFHRGPETLGMFFSVMGLGSILGALIIAGLGNLRRKGLIALTMLIVLGASVAGFSLSHDLFLSYGMLVVSGASMMAVFATMNSLVQLIVSNEMRGRVMSVYNLAFRGGMPFGNLAAGWLVKGFGAPVVLAVDGMLLVVLGLYYLLAERHVPQL